MRCCFAPRGVVPWRQEAGRKVNAGSPTGQVCKGSFLTINTCGRWAAPKDNSSAAFRLTGSTPVGYAFCFQYRVSCDSASL
jgi:hypothetical protein